MIAVYTPEVERRLLKENTHTCEICKTTTTVEIISDINNIFRKNMMNVKEYYKANLCPSIYDSVKDSYCSLVSWSNFCNNPQKYIKQATDKRDRINEFDIVKRL